MERIFAVAVAAWLALAGGAHAVVTVDVLGTDKVCVSGTSCDFTGLTITGGLTNSALVCMMSFDANVSTITSTWDNAGTPQTMTRIGTGVTTGTTVRRSELFGLVAPHSGNLTLHVTWTTTSQLIVNCESFSGANQTGSTTTFANANTATTGSGTAASIGVAITTTTSDQVVASCVQDAGTSFSTWSATNGTLTKNWIDNGGTSIDGGGASATPTTTSTTLTANFASSASHGGIIGVDLVAAAGGAAKCTQFINLMGVGC